MSEGWKCPVCNRGVSPSEKTCEHGGASLNPAPVYIPYQPYYPYPFWQQPYWYQPSWTTGGTGVGPGYYDQNSAGYIGPQATC